MLSEPEETSSLIWCMNIRKDESAGQVFCDVHILHLLVQKTHKPAILLKIHILPYKKHKCSTNNNNPGINNLSCANQTAITLTDRNDV